MISWQGNVFPYQWLIALPVFLMVNSACLDFFVGRAFFVVGLKGVKNGNFVFWR